jgi:putative transcriptional regulator
MKNYDIMPGKILIADPFLKDPNFLRTVVYICDGSEDGNMGFVINRKTNQTIGNFIEEIANCSFIVYYGGPVQLNAVFFLHTCPELIEGGIELNDGIFWGGNFQDVVEAIHLNKISSNEIRFYVGYSGWGKEQLQSELEQKAWLVAEGNKKLVFHPHADKVWQEAVYQLGDSYKPIVNYPIDPQLN